MHNHIDTTHLNRAKMTRENARARAYWTACQSLRRVPGARHISPHTARAVLAAQAKRDPLLMRYATAALESISGVEGET